jgi:hypothetical protein
MPQEKQRKAAKRRRLTTIQEQLFSNIMTIAPVSLKSSHSTLGTTLELTTTKAKKRILLQIPRVASILMQLIFNKIIDLTVCMNSQSTVRMGLKGQ